MARVAIKIEDGCNIRIIGGEIIGADIGVDVSDGENITLNGVRFDQVSTGLKARNVNRLKVSNCIDGSEKELNLTQSAKLVLFYISTLK